jgi:mRNA interferase MazF
VDPPEGGLTVTSFIICDQVRTISLERFGTRYGRIDDSTMGQVELRIRFLLELR